MDEIDIAKVQNYVDSKIIAPMNIQEQKALCRIVLDIAKRVSAMYVSIDWLRNTDPEIDKLVEQWMTLYKSEPDAK